MSSDAVSHHRQLHRSDYQDLLVPAPPTATGSLKIITSVEALALPVLLQAHDRTLSGAALVLTAWGEGHDTRPLRGVPSEL